MQIQSGRHAGKSCESMMINHPDLVQWMIEKADPSRTKDEFKRLVTIFDRRPIEETCHGCANVATRASLYQGGDDLMFWCDGCNEYGSGANRGKLRIVTRYLEVVRMIDTFAAGNKKFKFQMIRQLARGKGLAKRMTNDNLIDFFAA
ncbi:hypothetical protein [Rhizobium laguerreae]|uniref:hypothetical protein n=1 Tax=Rhizobium laguerreae TaxID=1076926 RepID=UPI001C8FC446|nr:hypothetical protein [Rhizobium laguerreae]MBY3171643.1 hypothetical protein [Rhizobium laguerreae]